MLVVNCCAGALPVIASADEMADTGKTVAVTVPSGAVWDTEMTVAETGTIVVETGLTAAETGTTVVETG